MRDSGAGAGAGAGGETSTARVDRLTKDIIELVETWSLRPLVRALQALRGVQIITAVIIAAELGDMARFPSAPALMAYLGLVPSEHSSGESQKRGRITRTGNRHVQDCGVDHLMRTFSALMSIGDDERLSQLEVAAEPFLRRFLKTPQPKRAIGKSESIALDEADKAIKLLREFARRREARIPRAIRMAEAIRDQLLTPAFAAVVGMSAWDLSDDAMHRLLNVNGARSFDTYDVAADWLLRLVDGRRRRPGPARESSNGMSDAVAVPTVKTVMVGR